MCTGPNATGVDVHGIRFPASEQLGVRTPWTRTPDCSAAYVVLAPTSPTPPTPPTARLCRTIGRGNDVTATATRPF